MFITTVHYKDVASFYAQYMEEGIEQEGDIENEFDSDLVMEL